MSTALDNGYTPVSKVLDAPFEMYQGPGLPIWRPENFEKKFIGLATLRRGLELSRNLMTIRLAQAVGMDKIAAYRRTLRRLRSSAAQTWPIPLARMKRPCCA